MIESVTKYVCDICDDSMAASRAETEEGELITVLGWAVCSVLRVRENKEHAQFRLDAKREQAELIRQAVDSGADPALAQTMFLVPENPHATHLTEEIEAVYCPSCSGRLQGQLLMPDWGVML